MPRKATGTVRLIGGRWFAKWTRADGTRSPWKPLRPDLDPTDRALAKAEAARMAPKVLEASAKAAAQSVTTYAAGWLDDREGRVNSIRDDRSRMRDHVLPLIGTLDARTFTRDDVERVRDALDAKITRGELAWKTAASVWTLLTSMCADMVNAKRREFRVRADNPAREVKPPERGARKAKQYLYPSEFLQFAACERVPLRWRRAVALAIYTYTRDAELRVLRWSDIDHGIVDITRAFNRRQPGEVKGTKSDAPRRFAVEPNLLPLLEVMRAASNGKGLVANLPSERAMARNLRRWLWKAGVRRRALHERTATSLHLTWHDLRATGATWMAVRGDDAHKIMQRCGHKSFTTTMLYVREGEAIREGFGEPFPPLPPELLGESSLNRPGTIRRRRSSQKQAVSSGVDGTRTREENVADPLEKQPDRASAPIAESSTETPVRDPSKPAETVHGSEPSDAALEAAIVQAATVGAWDVARVLAARLEARRRGGVVVPLRRGG